MSLLHILICASLNILHEELKEQEKHRNQRESEALKQDEEIGVRKEAI